jgi:outer membrane protein W
MIFRRTTLRVSSALILLTVLNSASADESNKWYTAANFGLGSLSSQTLTYSNDANPTTSSAEFDSGFGAGATLGYRFDNGWTLEGELMYRSNDLEPIDVPGLGNFEQGDFASLAIGINALYRFQLGDGGKFEGYVGPGFVYLQEIDIDFENPDAAEVSFETDETAWQLKLGGRYDFSQRWFVDASATYLLASGIEMERFDDSIQTIESDYDHLMLSVGVGFRF